MMEAIFWWVVSQIASLMFLCMLLCVCMGALIEGIRQSPDFGTGATIAVVWVAISGAIIYSACQVICVEIPAFFLT